MKAKFFFATAVALVLGQAASMAQPKVEIHGFIRNFYALDTRESISGTDDFFYYLPYDKSENVNGDDLNEMLSFSTGAITSRLWVEAKGFEFNGWKMGSRIEADFYNGLSHVTGTAVFRLRQAFATLSKDSWSFKFGQAWHPMAADMPDVFSLNTGAPFGPFSRTPQILADYGLGEKLSLSAAAIWQMQYTSTGPAGASADYIKYSCTPEIYLGLNYKSEGFMGRFGVDMLSIKPRNIGENSLGVKVKVNDRITTLSPFVYLQYANGKNFSVKFKSVFAQAGEHINLNGGYGVTVKNTDGSWEYAPTRNSSTWISFKYDVCPRFHAILFGGYVKNFGTSTDILSTTDLYFSKNSYKNMTQMARCTPTIIYDLGKFNFGLEYEMTTVQYGSFGIGDKRGLASENLHWVTNNRIQAMVKFTF